MEESPRVEEVHGWRCNFCGEIYPTKEEAEKCWERHIMFETDYVFALGEEFPVEVIVKKIEGERIVEIATYTLEKKEKVNLLVKRNEKEKKSKRGTYKRT